MSGASSWMELDTAATSVTATQWVIMFIGGGSISLMILLCFWCAHTVP